MFSTRTPADLTPNRLTQAVASVRAAGRDLIDLTESNPTRAGFRYPADLLAPLADSRGLTYAPHPFGAISARRAVSGELAKRGAAVPADQIVLTASTSESYGLLFKLLADAGDELLVPRPSYPLFDHLTRLEVVVARPYDIEYHAEWTIDLDSVERAWSDRTRAVLVVSPNNPTGSFVKRGERERLEALCAERDAAIVADEVFGDYELEPGAGSRAALLTGEVRALTFSLGGLSKSIGLPQVKLGWIAAAGPALAVDRALTRLELICDTYLSVSTPVQLAAAELLARGVAVRAQIAARVAGNYQRLRQEVAQSPSCRLLRAEGGWYGVVQVPSLGTEEELIVELVTAHGVLVHPGYFFDFASESYLVVSLLAPESSFLEGIRRVLRHVGRTPS
jgi:aspartate/methionine/tyrosine aminotransferase